MTTVLLLAGGMMKDKFDFLKMSSDCPALLPLNCKSITSYIVNFYSHYKDCEIFLATNSEYEEEVLQELSSIDYRMRYIFMPKTEGVIDSLEYCMTQLDQTKGSLIVNLITTIPVAFPELGDIQFSNELNYSGKWSGCYANANNGLELIYKNEKIPHSSIPFHAFTGVFHQGFNAVNKMLNNPEINKTDLLSLFKNENLNKYNIVKNDWLDCGHEINYYSTKTKLISSRSFNNITFVDYGIIKKKSDNADKLKDESEFLCLLPKDISVLFPRVIEGFYPEDKKGAYELEFYGYPSLAELFLYWDLSPEIWERMFKHFSLILNKFKQHPYEISKEDFIEFYKGKFYARVNEYLESLPNEERKLLEGELIVNGKVCKPLSLLENKINQKIDALYSEKDFCIMHGDLCFNNILYDIPTGITKLIDPRGSFSPKRKGIYGDIKYDLAKLAHSAIGGYDLFVNNKYSISQNDTVFEYAFLSKNLSLTTLLMEELIKEKGYKYEDIKFIMGTLFISMCPLHNDSAKRQKAFFVHGLKILNEVLDAY